MCYDRANLARQSAECAPDCRLYINRDLLVMSSDDERVNQVSKHAVTSIGKPVADPTKEHRFVDHDGQQGRPRTAAPTGRGFLDPCQKAFEGPGLSRATVWHARGSCT